MGRGQKSSCFGTGPSVVSAWISAKARWRELGASMRTTGQVALRERIEHEPSLRCTMAIRLRLCLLVAGAVLLVGPASAQAASLETTPGDANPTAPGQNVSKKLDQSNVIHPKEVDPAIEKPAPQTGDSNVVPPPGTSGGPSAPQPK